MLVGAEVFSWNAGDFGFLKQIIRDVAGGAESFTPAGFVEEPADVGKNVKRSLGFQTGDAGDGV